MVFFFFFSPPPSINIGGCFVNPWVTLSLPESVQEAVDCGGEGRCSVLVYCCVSQAGGRQLDLIWLA